MGEATSSRLLRFARKSPAGSRQGHVQETLITFCVLLTLTACDLLSTKNTGTVFDGDTPHVDSLVPPFAHYLQGGPVTLLGRGFIPGLAVFVGASECVRVVVKSAQEMTCEVLPGALGSVPVTLQIGSWSSGAVESNGTKEPTQFVFGEEPRVTAFNPARASMEGGTILTLQGENLPSASSGGVFVGGVACLITSATDSAVSCRVGPHPSGDVAIEVYPWGPPSEAGLNQARARRLYQLVEPAFQYYE